MQTLCKKVGNERKQKSKIEEKRGVNKGKYL
jgi:hypothetical protein